MKKIFAPIVALLPIVYLLSPVTCLLIDSSDSILLGSYGVYLLLTLVSVVLFILFRKAHSAKKLAIYNIVFSAGNLAVLVAQLVYWIISVEKVHQQTQDGGMCAGLLLVVLIILYFPHWISYSLVRIGSMFTCFRSLNGICPMGIKILHTIMHFLPLADLISSIIVLCKICIRQKMAQNQE